MAAAPGRVAPESAAKLAFEDGPASGERGEHPEGLVTIGLLGEGGADTSSEAPVHEDDATRGATVVKFDRVADGDVRHE